MVKMKPCGFLELNAASTFETSIVRERERNLSNVASAEEAPCVDGVNIIAAMEAANSVLFIIVSPCL